MLHSHNQLQEAVNHKELSILFGVNILSSCFTVLYIEAVSVGQLKHVKLT